ncbi:ion transporter [Alloalcanivorax sp. C16-1]|uniref:ion transporter n=1 Tax=Alloalcanivorax sp. C16-1 TaxID=3390051 RepID=UPI003970B04C
MNARYASLRDRWRHIIFGTDTPAGRWFDQLLILAIIASVVAVTLDSVQSIHQRHGTLLYAAEWFFTVLFTLEYIIRLWVSDRPLRYARSFYGVVDLVSVIPTYLSLLLPGANYLLTIRALRVLRVFRVLKLAHLMEEANQLGSTLVRTRRKIGVFMFAVVVVIIIFGSLMYVVEGPSNGFTSIPRSIYWAIVTITTVGYGDISPQTPFGQAVASLAMITGYAIIAVPTGIVTAEMSRAHMVKRYERECPNCHRHDHDPDARFCKQCGTGLPRPGGEPD